MAEALVRAVVVVSRLQRRITRSRGSSGHRTEMYKLARQPLEEQLKLEVRELTDLLRNAESIADFRAVLAAKGLSASETNLAGLIGSQDESRYGVILTINQECVVFETAPDGRLTRWELIAHPEALTSDFPAISVGIVMQRSREIS